MVFQPILDVPLSERREGEKIRELVERLFKGLQIDPNKFRELLISASAADYYDKNPWMHVNTTFTGTLDVVDFLRGNNPDSHSLSYLVQALWWGEKIPKNRLEHYQRIAGAADYYEGNTWLHVKKPFSNPYRMIKFLKRHAGPGISLGTLAVALWTGGKVPKKQLKYFSTAATASEYYDRNPWMHVDCRFSSPIGMVQFLIHNRHDNNSLSYLSQALAAGGKIPIRKAGYFQMYAGSADYALAKRDMIEQQIMQAKDRVERYLNSRNYLGFLKEEMDTSLFTRIANPTSQISRDYLRKVIKAAMDIYGNQIVGRT